MSKTKCTVEELKKHYGLTWLAKIPEYRIWTDLRQRCTKRTNHAWKNYGGRGIDVCRQWNHAHGFNQFLADMGMRPSPDHSIDRIDNNGPYSPSNCRWALPPVQNRNTRTNRFLTFGGTTKTISEWAAGTGIGRSTIEVRLRYGWTIEKALTEPVKQTPCLSTNERQQIIEMTRQQISAYKIAKLIGRARDTVAKVIGQHRR